MKRKRRCTLHASMVSEGFANFIPKEDRPANSRDVNPLETIWIIVDETTYKDPAPKTLDELRQWLRFAWKNVTLDTLWELVHSIPHRLENVRKHIGRHSGYWYFSYSMLNEISNVGKFPWSWFLWDRTQVYKEKENFVIACFTIWAGKVWREKPRVRVQLGEKLKKIIISSNF